MFLEFNHFLAWLLLAIFFNSVFSFCFQAQPKSAQRLPGAGRKVADKNFDDAIMQWLKDARKEGIAVSGERLRQEAKRKAEDHDFRASNGWLRSFKRRHTISTRMGTSIGQKLPPGHEEKLLTFQKYVLQLRTQHGYPLSHIFNMDETPMRFDMPGNRTLDMTGATTVAIKTTNSEKKGFTMVLCVAADGTKVKPWIIFKGVRDPKIPTTRAHIVMQKKGWIDEQSE